MDSIKNLLQKINFDNNKFKYFLIIILLVVILCIFTYLSKKDSTELFAVLEDCDDKYLLNYADDKTINSILIDKGIRYGFFKDINKTKNSYYDILISTLDSPEKSDKETINSIKLFNINSFENPIIVTPAKFQFTNDDKEYPLMKQGYDFNNVLFIFRINSFTEGENQKYGVLFENDIYELRLIEKKQEMNKQVFNLHLINKLTKSNIGFTLDETITNIELNKYYYGRISVITRYPNKEVCLTLFELEKNIYGTTLYQKKDTYENSIIKKINIDKYMEPFNQRNNFIAYTDKFGILKCKNTVIGTKNEDLNLSGEKAANIIASLNMDFGFISIGGGDKINISMMPDPPTTTTTTTTQPTIIAPSPVQTFDPIDLAPAEEYLDNIGKSINGNENENEDETVNEDENMNQFINIENVENFTNNDINDNNLINLTKIKNFFITKLENYNNIINENTNNMVGILAKFHYNYIQIFKNTIDDLINVEINNGRCNLNDTCYISKYYLKDDLNVIFKKILESYIYRVFNEKNSEGLNNEFIKALIIHDDTFETEPQGISLEINKLLDTMSNEHNLEIDFTIDISYSNNNYFGSQCNEKTNKGDMSDYRGCQNITRSGRLCQNWDEMYPHPHNNTPTNKPNKGLGNHNYCRNPDGEAGIWCYTTDPSLRWDYCDPIPQ